MTDNGKQRAGHIVLNNLNLSIKDGEFLTIVGSSGCGKSTLLNIISGIDNAYSGEVLLDNSPVSKYKNSDRIVVFQEAALFPWLTVFGNVELDRKSTRLNSSHANISYAVF